MKSVGSLPTAGPPQWIGNDGDAVARHHGPRRTRTAAMSSPWESSRRPGGRAGGPAAAVGAASVGQADGRAVAGDVPGIAFNARM